MSKSPRTETDVINRALILIKAPCITHVNEDSSTAKKAKLFYDSIVDEVARMHNWNSLQKRVCLPCDPECPKFGWHYSYTLPKDYARIVDVRGVSYMHREDRFEIECGKILVNRDCTGWKPWKKDYKTDEAEVWGGKDSIDDWQGNDPHYTEGDLKNANDFTELPITYVSNCKPPHEWDALLATAISYKLAAELAAPMDATDATAGNMYELAQRKLEQARGVDVHEDASNENNNFMRNLNRSALVQRRRRY